MDVLVVGLGSMGRRRIRLLHRFGQVKTIIGVDNRTDRQKDGAEGAGCKTYPNMEEALREYPTIQCAFICTSPLSHGHLIFEALRRGLHVFTELNLVSDGYEKNMALAAEQGKVLFLSSTQLYRKEIKFIQERIKREKGMGYIYHIGQYLPDWHPWEDFHDFFVGEERTNGCREIMAVELPWIVSAFGKVKDIHVISGNMSRLPVPYKDHYMIQMEHETGNKGILVVDVVSPKAVRNLEIYGESIYYCWDGSPESLQYFDRAGQRMRWAHLYDHAEQLRDYSSFVVEDAYQDEIQAFFDVIGGMREPLYGFREDLEILRLIDRIEGVCNG